MSQRTPVLLVALVALGVVWGLTVVLTKIAVSSGHRPLGLIVWQLAFASLALIPLVRLSGQKLHLSRANLRYFLVIALIGTLLPNSFSYLAAAELPAGVMAIAIASVPMFALAIAVLIGGEPPSARRTLGVLLGGAAVVALIGPDTSLPEPEKAVFVLVALIAPLCYGAEGNYIASQHGATPSATLTLLGASLTGLVLAVPLALATDSWVDLRVAWQAPEYALLASSMCHVCAYVGYIWLVGRAGAVFASQVSYVVTPSGVLLGAVLLGELHSGWVWLALVLMLIGVALVRPREQAT